VGELKGRSFSYVMQKRGRRGSMRERDPQGLGKTGKERKTLRV
jgi:hypothetical protein